MHMILEANKIWNSSLPDFFLVTHHSRHLRCKNIYWSLGLYVQCGVAGSPFAPQYWLRARIFPFMQIHFELLGWNHRESVRQFQCIFQFGRVFTYRSRTYCRNTAAIVNRIFFKYILSNYTNLNGEPMLRTTSDNFITTPIQFAMKKVNIVKYEHRTYDCN